MNFLRFILSEGQYAIKRAALDLYEKLTENTGNQIITRKHELALPLTQELTL